MAKATSRDVAKLAGVSQSTVSMILNEKRNVSFSRETVEHVLAAAKELNYEGSFARRGEKQGRGRAIAVFCPTLDNPYYTLLVQTISKLSQSSGYAMLVCDTYRRHDAEESYVRLLDGVICGAVYTYLPQYKELYEQLSDRVPVVILGDKDFSISADAVELNSIKSGALVAQHLIGLGHVKIAYLTTPVSERMLARSRRLQGILDEYKRQGYADGVVVKAQKTYCERSGMPLNAEYCAGYDLTRELLESGDTGVTAFVGLNDMVALGIMDALIDAKFKIPQDYSVVGCDNNLISGLRRVSLTTVEHYTTQKGRDAFEMLLNKMEHSGSREREPAPQKIISLEYEPRLIVRGTTGPNRRRGK